MARSWADWAPLRAVDDVAIFRLREGKIVHAWSLEDTLSRLRQLGLTSQQG
jgi:hypothetical protein